VIARVIFYFRKVTSPNALLGGDISRDIAGFAYTPFRMTSRFVSLFLSRQPAAQFPPRKLLLKGRVTCPGVGKFLLFSHLPFGANDQFRLEHEVVQRNIMLVISCMYVHTYVCM
jgi:hypothetical protein